MGSTGELKSSFVPEGLLPSYLASAFAELYEEDGLAVLAKGLGWMDLLASFVRFYSESKPDDETSLRPAKCETGNPPLVLVVGLRDIEHDMLLSILGDWGTPYAILPTMITNESGQGKDRADMYRRGGVFSVTSRILIVDLLTNVLNPTEIDGMLVAHGEQVTPESTEAFILRIYTNQKRRDQCFIKAFTDSPETFLSGFSRIDKTLKSLQVRRLHLYPRFHETVKVELEKFPPEVEELHQTLSPAMKEIQNAIVAAVQTCMRELKRATPFVEWGGTELSIQNCVAANFDRAVSRELEKDWHKLKPQTKQLVQDLRTLRTLFQSLIRYDCVSFWQLINSIKTMSAASRNPSMWLLTPSADILFKKAKERIYRIEGGKPSSLVPKPIGKMVPVLEENPKWRLLKELLRDIKNSLRVQEGPREATVLVVVKDQQSVDALRSYLVEGRDRTMALRWLRFLEHFNDRSRSVADCKISEESRLLLEEEGRVRRIFFGSRSRSSAAVRKVPPQSGFVPGNVKKRRKIALEKGRGHVKGGSEDREREAILGEAVEEAEHYRDVFRDDGSVTSQDSAGADALYDKMLAVSLPKDVRVVLKCIPSVQGEALTLLRDLQPCNVILYDADISFVRTLEVYSALTSNSSQNCLKVHILSLESSAEQKVFMKSLEREQDAFMRLINHKKTMPPPVLQIEGTQEVQQAMATGAAGGTYHGGTLPLAFDTRQGQGRANTTEKRDIAVDVREFRSALPSILHQGGMRLAPVTLTVGDFVLSKVHCIERKSISDLFGSFSSGRLFSQAEAMCKYYKCPSLLIEFDPQKSFSLQNASELGVDIRSESVCSKMALLTMHFPRLRILWSRSTHETLRLFKELKSSHDEVDVETAVEIGRKDTVEALLREDGEEVEDDGLSEVAKHMLLQLPGVTVHNARRIMRECRCLSDLAEMDRECLRRIAGPVAGQKLFTFFGHPLGGT